MKPVQIMLAGVGGQGLVLTTRLIARAAFSAGRDVKTNDVVGLSQRGGRIWGTVKFGDKIHSPNIGPGQADFLLAMETLEGLRWKHILRPGGWLILNEQRLAPTPVLMEQAAYPQEAFEAPEGVRLLRIDAPNLALELGNPKVANAILVGALAARTLIPKALWQDAIESEVPSGTEKLNLKAFETGYGWK